MAKSGGGGGFGSAGSALDNDDDNACIKNSMGPQQRQ